LELLAYSLKPGNFAIVEYTFLTEDPNVRELIEPHPDFCWYMPVLEGKTG
jgi:hypothetical protein